MQIRRAMRRSFETTHWRKQISLDFLYTHVTLIEAPHPGWSEGWAGRLATTSESGVSIGRGMGQQGSVLMASHQACHESEWFLAPMAGEEWRERGARGPPPWPN